MNREHLTVLTGAIKQDELADYVRCVANADSWSFEAATIGGENSYTPMLTWHAVRSWPTRPTDDDIAQAIDQVFNDLQYFRHCAKCNRHFCAGHMHDSNACQGCAEQYMGVVH